MVCYLSDFLEELNERTIKNDQYPVLTSSKSGIYLQSEYFNKQVASRDNTGYKVIHRDEFTYRAMSDTGEFYPNLLECTDVGIVSPAYPVFKNIHPEIIENQYLKWFFRSQAFQHSISAFAQGSTRTSVKFSKLRTVKIKFPALEIQHQQVSAMESANSIIEERQQQFTKMDELVKARFVEMFGDPVTNPFNWPTVELGQRCEIITGNTPSRAEPENYGTYIEWIKSDNINTPSTFLTLAQEYLSEVGFQKCRFVESGSLLMTCIAGSLNCIGNVAVTNRRVAFNQQINAITPTCDNVLYLYWLMILSKPAIHKTINMALKGILSKSQLSSIKFPFPPIECQNQFAAFVAEVDKSKVEVQKALDQTQLLFDSLMQQYFR